MKRLVCLLLLALNLIGLKIVLTEPAMARQGCCSHHGGVCGCKCCDGTSLSVKCAPYYPACNTNTKGTGAFISAPPRHVQAQATQTRSNTKSVQTKIVGASFNCKVVGVHDGDTLTCLESQTNFKIRLAGIDAPETKQPYGEKARQFSSNKVFARSVRIKVTDIDRYGRLVAEVVLNNERLNYELVRAGLAWHYGQYSRDLNTPVLEKQARIAKRGLWADAHPIEPWIWRKQHG